MMRSAGGKPAQKVRRTKGGRKEAQEAQIMARTDVEFTSGFKIAAVITLRREPLRCDHVRSYQRLDIGCGIRGVLVASASRRTT